MFFSQQVKCLLNILVRKHKTQTRAQIIQFTYALFDSFFEHEDEFGFSPDVDAKVRIGRSASDRRTGKQGDGSDDDADSDESDRERGGEQQATPESRGSAEMARITQLAQSRQTHLTQSRQTSRAAGIAVSMGKMSERVELAPGMEVKLVIRYTPPPDPGAGGTATVSSCYIPGLDQMCYRRRQMKR